MKPFKILAIQFKYLGDAVILTPALKALAAQIPNIELHVLVAAEAAPLLEDIPWIARVWAMPRERGKIRISITVPFILALRREKFDQSIDFGGNDRGALLSFLSGANRRLGASDSSKVNWIQRNLYTRLIVHKHPTAPYFDLYFELLQALNVTRPQRLKLEICVNDAESASAKIVFSADCIIFHISTSQPKKDWPLCHWQTLYDLGCQAGLKIIFSAGPNQRERNVLNELKSMRPEAELLPAITDLKSFLRVIKRCNAFVCGDTGPLHFAEGMGVPVLGIFGVGNSIRQVAAIYSEDQIVRSEVCACDLISNTASVCLSPQSCMASIRPEVVFKRLKDMLGSVDAH